jgi:hypothetical protein
MGELKHISTPDGTHAYWYEELGSETRSVGPDTTAYQTYAAKDDPRRRCDTCNACVIYNCNGITARHHFIHLNEFDLLSDPEGDEHSDRDSGV